MSKGYGWLVGRVAGDCTDDILGAVMMIHSENVGSICFKKDNTAFIHIGPESTRCAWLEMPEFYQGFTEALKRVGEMNGCG